MSGRPPVVFVVDDNQLNLELATDVLEAAGYVVRRAASGPDAIAAVQREAPDLLLLDLGLPGMDGYAVLRALRADPGTATIPAVALTAYAMAADEQRVLDAGFDGYLTKPINTRTFAAAVSAILQARGATS